MPEQFRCEANGTIRTCEDVHEMSGNDLATDVRQPAPLTQCFAQTAHTFFPSLARIPGNIIVCKFAHQITLASSVRRRSDTMLARYVRNHTSSAHAHPTARPEIHH